MSIQFICPHCGVATEVAEKFAGQEGPCAHCGKPITIPFMLDATRTPMSDVAKTLLGILAVVLAVVVAGAAILAVVIVPRVANARATARRIVCKNNLQQIALAIKTYESANGNFPPAYVVDKHGKPLYSWRVLLLPYLERQELADQFHFDEPWNSPNNRTITSVPIDLFQCPAQPDRSEPTTNYMMVVGPHTISSGRASAGIDEIADGLAGTIMVVEVADSDVRWAEPQDLQFDKFKCAINGDKRPCISSRHPRGANVAFCDESVHFLKNSTPPELVRAMLTIDRGEDVPPLTP